MVPSSLITLINVWQQGHQKEVRSQTRSPKSYFDFFLGLPVIHTLASSAEFAIRSNDFPSPCMMEREHSSGKCVDRSDERNRSVVFPGRTSRMDANSIFAFPASFFEGSQRRQLKKTQNVVPFSITRLVAELRVKASVIYAIDNAMIVCWSGQNPINRAW